MKKLAKPTIKAKDVYNTCNSRVRNAGLRGRLDAFVNTVKLEERQFETAGKNAQLHAFPAFNLNGANVTRDELVKVYDDRMANQSGPGRHYYNLLRSSAPHDECPLCSHGVVKTLDHYLPKNEYPVLSVVPLNLVPACRDCNTEKLTYSSTSEDEMLFNPYYDNIDGDIWLRAIVQETSPVALLFDVDAPNKWSRTLANRIRNHFEKLKLGELYSTQAARLLVEIKLEVGNIFAAAGTQAVREHLTEAATSREQANLNSWQSASYRALANNLWYCTGGFR